MSECRIFCSAGKLRGVRLGALGFDDCMNPIMLNHLVTEVQRYGTTIYDENGENKLDPRTVEAFMTTGLDPWQAISMADLMNTMKRPVVGAETYTTGLNDFEQYPYFIRANYDQANISMAFVNVAKRNGWKYMQAVYHDDDWGEESFNVLRKIAAQEGICIVASFALSDNGIEVVTGLRGRRDVQPVALLLSHEGFRTFMEGVKLLNATNEFQLISSLGNSVTAVKDYEDYVSEMISFEFWNGPKMEEFKNHLRSLDPSTYTTNPWMKEWYENTMGCSFEPTGSQTACGTENMFGSVTFDYDLDASLISVIYGVVAIAQGLDATLKQYCGTGKSFERYCIQ